MSWSRTFHEADQQRFARFSGDFNPLHLDPLVARRTMFGAPVVHGMHLLLWAAECAVEHVGANGEPAGVGQLAGVVRRPARLGEQLVCSVVALQAPSMSLQIDGPSGAIATIEVTTVGVAEYQPVANIDRYQVVQPAICQRADVLSTRVVRQVVADDELCGELFPALHRSMGANATATLAALSAVVGMDCPGLHSVFHGVQTHLLAIPGHGPGSDHQLVTTVRSFDPRFSRIALDVVGQGLTAEIDAFFRPEPVDQPPSSQLAEMVRSDEFGGQRALVIGGSRGLGEVAAKLLAAGGADVWLTYQRGAADARAVCADIAAAGGSAHTPHTSSCDVANPTEGFAALADAQWAPTHLYYFATPPIFQGVGDRFSDDLLDQFRAVYTTGFSACVQRWATTSLRGVLYPSSVAATTPVAALAEYAAAKVEGEHEVDELRRRFPHLHLHVERFPRLATDQTTSLMPVDNAPVAAPLLAALRITSQSRPTE